MERSASRELRENEDSISQYFIDIRHYPLLRPDEEVDLASRIRKGERKALVKLIQANLRFVVSIAMDYKNQGVPLCDLINEGNIGLIKAAHKFDETKGFKFISYAVWWIRQSIMQALADHARVVRLPINRITSVNRIGKASNTLEQEFERTPTNEEIASILEISSREVAQAMQYPGRQISLDGTQTDNDRYSLYSNIPQELSAQPDQPLADESLKQEIAQALDSLTPKEAEVLQLYFGIEVEREYTLDEIARKYRLTRERVRQIKEKALFRLRHQSRSKALRQYLG